MNVGDDSWSARGESYLQWALRERPWRHHEAERREPCFGLRDLFHAFSESRTNSFAARGLVQGVVLATGERGNPAWQNTDDGRSIRELIVAFLTDIGSEAAPYAEHDPEVRRTARTTLVKHVLPHIAAYSQLINGYMLENFGTLVRLVEFYGTREPWYHDPLNATYGYVRTLTGGFLKNVQECLTNVYRELRRHLGKECDCGSHGGHTAGEQLRRLNRVLVDLCWWSALSKARTVSAIPEIYAAARAFTDPQFSDIHLTFDWSGVDEHQIGGLLTQPAFIAQHREEILYDVWAIQLVSGGGGNLSVPDIDDGFGFRVLLLDLAATFVREVELAHPGVLMGR